VITNISGELLLFRVEKKSSTDMGRNQEEYEE
jgi:hypothetical protein